MTTSSPEPLPVAGLLGSVVALAASLGVADALLLAAGLGGGTGPLRPGDLGLAALTLAVLDGLVGLGLALLAGPPLLLLRRMPQLRRHLPDLVFSALGLAGVAAMGYALIRPSALGAVDVRALVLAGLLLLRLALLRARLARPARDRLFAGGTVLFGLTLVLVTGFALLLGRPFPDAAVEQAVVETSVTGAELSGLLRRASDTDHDGWPTLFCGRDCDCNDRDPEVHPAAIDVPGDGVDTDCDGRDR